MERIADRINDVVESLSGWIEIHPDIWRLLCGLREPCDSDVFKVIQCVNESVDEVPELAVAITLFLAKNYRSAKNIIQMERAAVQYTNHWSPLK